MTLRPTTTTRFRIVENAHRQIIASRDVQYLFASIEADFPETGDCPIPSGHYVNLRIDDARQGTVASCAYEYEYDRGQGPISFGVPATIEATTGEFVWFDADGQPAANWALPSRLIDRLNDPPSFAVRSISADDETKAGTIADLALQIENTGGHSGTFAYRIEWPNRSHPVLYRVTVPAKSAIEETHSFELPGKPGDTVEVRVEWGYGEHTETMHILD